VLTVLAASGKDVILVETVGVGQDEVEIVGAADVSVVVLVPGLGDEVQALKAGIMEIADVFVVNKSDREGADRVVAEIESMLSLVPDGQAAARDRAHGRDARRGHARPRGRGPAFHARAADRAPSPPSGAAAPPSARRGREAAARGKAGLHAAAGETDALVERIARREIDPFTAADELTSRAVRHEDPAIDHLGIAVPSSGPP
jgi:LAO/AO transport system kinase